MPLKKSEKRNPWYWVPSLYFAEGIPYTLVIIVSVIMYKRLGVSNTDIALYTSWLYLPWVIKPLWSPFIDIFKTKRFWILTMQFFIGAGLAGVAFTIPTSSFFQYTLAFFWLTAFSSATHDIAADGFYMLALSEHDQSWFVGIRSTFYRFAFITGQGLLVILAGHLESSTGLKNLEIEVLTNTNIKTRQIISIEDVKFEYSQGEQSILKFPEKLILSTENLPRPVADSIISFAKNWNSKYNFNESYGISKAGADNKKELASNDKSWWQRNVSGKLAKIIKKYFGQNAVVKPFSKYSGNLGVVYFSLAKRPLKNQKVVVNFGRESGDQSFTLVEGSRFVFNNSNWNKPAMAVIQIDPKLKTESSAVFQARSGNIPLAWMITFVIVGAMFFFFLIYHKFILPYPSADKKTVSDNNTSLTKEFFVIFLKFFKKKNIGLIISYILIYRLGEAQLVKLAAPFLLDAQEVGGLGLTTGQIGFVYGTIGIIALTIGGLLGGFLAAKHGLKYWIWYMVAAINIPDAVYIYLSYTQTTNFFLINLMVALEQFGYGFGFTAYMLYLIYVSEGDNKTAHFAIATGLMALGMMLPGMISGWLQEIIGYQHFFIWVLLATIPAFILTKFIHIDPEFGKKN